MWPEAAAQPLGVRQRHRRRRRQQGPHLHHSSRRRLARAARKSTRPRTRRTSECCVPAPPVVEFDAEGNLVHAWGGPGQGYEWPESNHGITPDSKGNLFIGGNGAQRRPHPEVHAGRQVRQAVRLRLRQRRQQRHVGVQQGRQGLARREGERGVRGRRLRQPARRGHRHGHRQDQALLGRLRQQAGRHATLGRYNPDAPLAQQFRNPVHCAEPSNDGFVYVCDRPNDRIQVFTKEGKFVKETQVVKTNTRGDGSVWDIAFSKDPAAEVLLPRRRRQREDPRVRSRSR